MPSGRFLVCELRDDYLRTRFVRRISMSLMKVGYATLCLSIVGASLAEDQAAPTVTGSLALEAYSKYVWRGLNSNDDWVFWPCLSVAYGPWSAYVFGSMELTNANSYGPTPRPEGKFTEYDVNLTYAGNLDKYPFTLGAVQYVYPKTGSAQTGELYGTISAPVVGNPTLSVYWDYEVVHGFYASLSGDHEIVKVKSVPLTVTASVGYGDRNHNAYYYGYANDTFADCSVGLNAEFGIGKNMTLTPSIKYTRLVDDGLLKGYRNRENVVVGLSFNLSF